MAVREDVILDRRPDVQRLVDGIARSGLWLDQKMSHRWQAAAFAGKSYFHQDTGLLRFVLSQPPDRVKYTNLSLHRKDFEEIEALGVKSGILKGTAHFEDYADTTLARGASDLQPYSWEAPR